MTASRDSHRPQASGSGRPGARISCCGHEWAGADRAHCCRRFRGCGHVFDDPDLWDAHRRGGRCTAPRELGLIQTTTGVWVRALDCPPPLGTSGR